jgi:uncharacterized phage protein (TIGR01671 family)
MREIKFRAWDKWIKKFVWDYDVYIALCGDLVEHGYEGIESCSEGQYTLNQYTGLHDKNGKEIYEGDIVKSMQDFGYDDFADMRELIEVVEYHEGAFYPICDMPERYYKVIGNIYENPDLLEAQNG